MFITSLLPLRYVFWSNGDGSGAIDTGPFLVKKRPPPLKEKVQYINVGVIFLICCQCYCIKLSGSSIRTYRNDVIKDHACARNNTI